jgi:hypothetical protein
MTWATDVVNIMCLEKDGLGYWCCNITCQEIDGMGYWCC